jgi:DNA-binding transcriptional regulator GbsR (MarR family)
MPKKIVAKTKTSDKSEKIKPPHKVPKQLPKDLIALEKTIGQFMEYWGFKSIHGRIWAHLYTSKAPLDSIELMERLGVSKGLMSLAMRELVEYDVIKVDHVGRHGSAFYVSNPDIIKVITGVLRIRETKMIAQAQKACEALQKLKQKELDSAGLEENKIQSVLDLTKSAQFLLDAFVFQESEGDSISFFKSVISGPH